jgi:hypothetical protein
MLLFTLQRGSRALLSDTTRRDSVYQVSTRVTLHGSAMWAGTRMEQSHMLKVTLRVWRTSLAPYS